MSFRVAMSEKLFFKANEQGLGTLMILCLGLQEIIEKHNESIIGEA